MSGYGSPYQQPPRRTGRTVLTIIGIAVGLFVLCCCGTLIYAWQRIF